MSILEGRWHIKKLDPFFEGASLMSWAIIRLTIGSMLLIHGWTKVPRGPASFSQAYESLGFYPGAAWAWCSTLLEVSAGLCIMAGLFTRLFAAVAMIELFIITAVYLGNGFSWLNRGYEFTLMWGLICFAIALRGGGPYSLDRKIGRKL